MFITSRSNLICKRILSVLLFARFGVSKITVLGGNRIRERGISRLNKPSRYISILRAHKAPLEGDAQMTNRLANNKSEAAFDPGFEGSTTTKRGRGSRLRVMRVGKTYWIFLTSFALSSAEAKTGYISIDEIFPLKWRMCDSFLRLHYSPILQILQIIICEKLDILDYY